MNNMELYEQFRTTPSEAKKTIDAGRLKGFTDINPMWRIKRLTEVFGPCGVGWWFTIDDTHIEEGFGGEKKAFVEISLYYIDAESGTTSHAVKGVGGSAFVAKEKSGLYVNDECFKMAVTDAIGSACKMLGMSADIFFEKDRTKYSTPPEQPEAEQTETKRSKVQIDALIMLASRKGVTCDKLLKKYKVKNLADLPEKEYLACLKGLEKMPDSMEAVG
jgi:hypothetical protein